VLATDTNIKLLDSLKNSPSKNSKGDSKNNSRRSSIKDIDK